LQNNLWICGKQKNNFEKLKKNSIFVEKKMQLVYRNTAQIVNHHLHLNLPDFIDNQEVEVIIIPIAKKKQNPDFNSFFGISNLGTDLINNHLESIRDDWDRTLLD